jgi:hypothetical protein
MNPNNNQIKLYNNNERNTPTHMHIEFSSYISIEMNLGRGVDLDFSAHFRKRSA